MNAAMSYDSYGPGDVPHGVAAPASGTPLALGLDIDDGSSA